MSSLIARRCVIFLLIIISFYMGVVNGSITLVGRDPALSFDYADALFGMPLFVAFNIYFFSSDSIVEDIYYNYKKNWC
jgi:hypothetical protein